MTQQMRQYISLDKAEVIFWDFDGVIKDSIDAKTKGFELLFEGCDPSVKNSIKSHHEANGGLTRYQKIPLYLEWAGISVTDEIVDHFCERFSSLVFDMVIRSPWVPGVREFL